MASTEASSRLPRLASPTPVGSTLKSLGLPPQNTTTVSTQLTDTEELNHKRKATSSPKPMMSRKASSSSLVSSTLGAPNGGPRKPSGGFVPTSRKATAGSSMPPPAATTIRSVSSSSKPALPMARKASTSDLKSSTRSVSGSRPGVPGARTTRSNSVSESAGIRRPAVATVSGAGSRAGTTALPGRRGVLSASTTTNIQSKGGAEVRLENMEKMLKAMFEKEQANIETQAVSKADFQNLLKSIHDPEREARRELSNASEEIAILQNKHAKEIEEIDAQLRKRERDNRNLEEEIQEVRQKLSDEREAVRSMKRTLAEQSTQHMTLNAQLAASQAQQTALQAEIERATFMISSLKAEVDISQQKVLESEERAASRERAAEERANERIADIETELREAETIRRKLHNQVQELKGNIRVFARVRPALPHEATRDDLATLTFSDEKLDKEMGCSQLSVINRGESATGKEREQVNDFTFDKVFQPSAGQQEVFEEISTFAQSVLDGYNVCIFAYGQTGSGKSWTMEGGLDEANVGMIPRAIEMIFRVSGQLKDRGWKYHMEGQYLEVYNEVINDLLGTGQFDTKKHEIKLDKDGKMSVSDVVSVPLSNARQVATLLERARSRRAVAATLMNERSSRSHSVFTLKVRGVNPSTSEQCEAMLNLVDLAGSERLASSGAGENKDRLKETININKSLSALADVIGALGQGQQGGHVPYRNSTLTRLLQTSLSGSSKTLMMCNISPLQAHVGETLCSLRFATKVNSTVVGKVQKQILKG
ncbi:P-loop containing nucleoside triphosphate hydrolase protein [Kockovaella imperatae]|uniref:Kinesin-like protein n=1 Tax=Kockovaella imperatae TaxID=4999 RepID=A0A1Y1UM98_9TREE|nr:P-loop containing nucleoside triphosphate hydrolase protein [Kockovaella imperatae]ORX39129.1 P-loop containing nucleoside triphosphate hydrolase protein [Kockovaella imperatae]